jgi:hypothetical protein
VYTTPTSKKNAQAMNASMREFRAAPAKLLRRAARTGTKLRIGEFIIEVREERGEPSSPPLYGAMSTTGRVVGRSSALLSADDEWSTGR